MAGTGGLDFIGKTDKKTKILRYCRCHYRHCRYGGIVL